MGPKLALYIPIILTYNSPFLSMFCFEVVGLIYLGYIPEEQLFSCLRHKRVQSRRVVRLLSRRLPPHLST